MGKRPVASRGLRHGLASVEPAAAGLETADEMAILVSAQVFRQDGYHRSGHEPEDIQLALTLVCFRQMA